MSAPLHCTTCGRSGNTDDAIEIGGPCQEPCEGTVEATPESIAEHDYVFPPGVGEAGYLRFRLDLAMTAQEIGQLAGVLQRYGWDVVADQIMEELSDWTLTA